MQGNPLVSRLLRVRIADPTGIKAGGFPASGPAASSPNRRNAGGDDS
jgi:hypothetical protein